MHGHVVTRREVSIAMNRFVRVVGTPTSGPPREVSGGTPVAHAIGPCQARELW